MPTFIIEGPQGLKSEHKKAMIAEASAALREAYQIPDVRIFIREHLPANAAQDGNIEVEAIRPVCFIEAPQGPDLNARRVLIGKLDTAIAKAYAGIANTEDILILVNEYPLELAGAGGRLQSENPDILAAMQKAAE